MSEFDDDDKTWALPPSPSIPADPAKDAQPPSEFDDDEDATAIEMPPTPGRAPASHPDRPKSTQTPKAEFDDDEDATAIEMPTDLGRTPSSKPPQPKSIQTPSLPRAPKAEFDDDEDATSIEIPPPPERAPTPATPRAEFDDDEDGTSIEMSSSPTLVPASQSTSPQRVRTPSTLAEGRPTKIPPPKSAEPSAPPASLERGKPESGLAKKPIPPAAPMPTSKPSPHQTPEPALKQSAPSPAKKTPTPSDNASLTALFEQFVGAVKHADRKAFLTLHHPNAVPPLEKNLFLFNCLKAKAHDFHFGFVRAEVDENKAVLSFRITLEGGDGSHDHTAELWAFRKDKKWYVEGLKKSHLF